MAKKKKDQRPFWAGDCETDPFLNGRVPKPFIWGLYTGHSFHTFRTAQEFVDFIKDHDVIVYFHNGGKFDMHFLLEWINLAEEIKVIGGRLVVAKIGKAELRDSWNILPVALKVFGQKLEIDYRFMEADVREQHMPQIIEYLSVDCSDLWNNINRFEIDYGRHLTQAGASMAQWKKISGLKPPKTDRHFFAKFSQYYGGGRVECFRKGHINEPSKIFDIRSAYPWAMLHEHPYAPDYIETAFPRTVNPTSMLKLTCISAGALHWRDDKGSMIFPNDNEKRTYHTTGHEYLAAMETGSLRDVTLINSIDFLGLQDFKVYINHFYEKRKVAREAGDVPQTVFTKLLMNSLYGKFAANPDNYGNFMCVDFADMNNHEDYTFDGMIGPHVLLKRPLDFWQENFINVATAASITGMVRAKLWRAINGCDGPIYCDTDSLICRDAPDLELGKELGQWNHEGDAHEGFVAGKKMYAFYGQFEDDKTEKLASKGVRLSAAEIKKAAMGETITAKSEAPTFTLKGKRRVYFQERRVRSTA